MTSSILWPLLHHTFGAALSHTEVGVQLTNWILYNLMFFPGLAVSVVLTRKVSLKPHADTVHSVWLVQTQTYSDTSAGVGVCKKFSCRYEQEISCRCGCKVMQMETGKPSYHDTKSTSCLLVWQAWKGIALNHDTAVWLQITKWSHPQNSLSDATCDRIFTFLIPHKHISLFLAA